MTVIQELTCRELVELVTDYLERAMPRSERRRFERHIARCDGCTAYLEQMRQVIRKLGKLTEDSLTAEARGELLHTFQDWKAG